MRANLIFNNNLQSLSMMATIQKLFTLSFFAFITLFNQLTVDAIPTPYIKIEGLKGESYSVERVEAPLIDGKHLIANNKRSGSKIILMANRGKIQNIFVQSISGKIQILEATTTDCSKDGLCKGFQMQKCFILPSGDCFCVCGNWFASNSDTSALVPDVIIGSGSGLKKKRGVIIATRGTNTNK